MELKNHTDIDFGIETELKLKVENESTSKQNDEYFETEVNTKIEDTQKIKNEPNFEKESKFLTVQPCELCDATVLSETSLTTHYRKTHQIYPCAWCLFLADNLDNLTIHRRSEHEKLENIRINRGQRLKDAIGNVSCKYCDKKFGNKDITKKHEFLKHEGSLYQCGQCDYESEEREEIGIHNAYNHNDGEGAYSFDCTACDFKVKARSHLRNHITQKHPELADNLYKKKERDVDGNLLCRYCDFKSKFKSSLLRHELGDHEGRRFKCDECNWETKQKLLLKQHKSYKHNEGSGAHTFDCTACDFKAKVQSRLRGHICTEHPEMAKALGKKSWTKPKASESNDSVTELKCKECDQQFKSFTGLRQHTQMKHEGVVYSCETCSFKSSYKQALKHHIQMKHEGLIFTCENCSFKTVYRQSMRLHKKKIVDGVCPPRKKPSFSYKEIPTPGVKMLKCDECDYTTEAKGSLHIHTKNRITGSMYNCHICDYRNCFHVGLRIHIKHVHNETIKIPRSNNGKGQKQKKSDASPNAKKYSCSECDYTTETMHCLRVHLKNRSEGPSFKCHKCEYRNCYRFGLRKHRTKVHNEKIQENTSSTSKSLKTYNCTDCKFVTNYRHSLVHHARTQHNRDIILLTCNLCSFQTAKQQLLFLHESDQHGRSFLKCDTCKFLCTKSRRMDIHKKRNLKCSKFCDFMTCSNINLAKHKKKVHNNDETLKKKKSILRRSSRVAAKKLGKRQENIASEKPSPRNDSLHCDDCGFRAENLDLFYTHILEHLPEERSERKAEHHSGDKSKAEPREENTAAVETKTEKAVSDVNKEEKNTEDMLDGCVNLCRICDKKIKSFSNFCLHISHQHKMSWTEYKVKHGESEVVTKMFTCQVCCKEVKHSSEVIYSHLNQLHQMSWPQYKEIVLKQKIGEDNFEISSEKKSTPTEKKKEALIDKLNLGTITREDPAVANSSHNDSEATGKKEEQVDTLINESQAAPPSDENEEKAVNEDNDSNIENQNLNIERNVQDIDMRETSEVAEIANEILSSVRAEMKKSLDNNEAAIEDESDDDIIILESRQRGAEVITYPETDKTSCDVPSAAEEVSIFCDFGCGVSFSSDDGLFSHITDFHN